MRKHFYVCEFFACAYNAKTLSFICALSPVTNGPFRMALTLPVETGEREHVLYSQGKMTIKDDTIWHYLDGLFTGHARNFVRYFSID